MWSLVATFCVVFVGANGQNALSNNFNFDGSSSVAAKLGLVNSDSNALSALLSKTSTGAVSKGLALDNVNGHGLSVTHTKIPDFGSQVTGAGHVNLLHNDNHNLNANAFVTRNMPDIPNVPNFNTVGAGVDYMFKDRVGAAAGVANTPFLQRTDYSALGKLNLFHDRTSSVDLNAGFSKSVSPFIPKQSWQPTGGLSFTKYFK